MKLSLKIKFAVRLTAFYYWNLLFVNNVFIIGTKGLPYQEKVTLVECGDPV